MKPVWQTLFDEGGGNCFAACVASILQMPLEKMPNFCEKDHHESWLRAFCAWLRPLGFTACCLDLAFKGEDGKKSINFFAPETYYILSGKSPRGDWLHATVWHGPDMAHDPHPEGGGVETFVDVVLILPLRYCLPKRSR